ncbi:UV radiation resistance-associated gene protein [Drosophila albomicans]|uniref:UV radiation resistance-associated gene protein n=1 Tax=Drosophila albomicans TaxID=7291 RepID=A0A9C6WD36_DROAB|nr:UV radiation resistance-associated gene protein [Drosophila albomicans]
MHLRPRCCEWLPLATQQLRLRNLARIQGLNIKCTLDANININANSGSGECGVAEQEELLLYYTLHADKASEAFYTSEALPQRHQQQKWAEICAGDEAWRKSNAQCVCVKVWAHYQPTAQRTLEPNETEQISEPQQSAKLSQRLANVHLTPHKLPRPPELLFSWGVYFSGLIPVAQLALANCRINCLIFQLNGELFTSPALISEQGLHAQLHLHYQRYAELDNNKRNASDAGGINSPSVSRSGSPVLQMSTMRYAQLSCQLADMRRSYNLESLLLLQRRQRDQRKKLRDIAEISSEIARLSVRCITRNELRLKPRTTSISGSPYGSLHSQQYHSMGRTLSVLLAEQQEIAPLTLYSAQQLMQQIEALRCKKRLLETERETFKERNAQKQEHLQLLREERDQVQRQLHNQLLKLEQQRLELRTEAPKQSADREQKRQITLQVERSMSTLVLELQEIYDIKSMGSQQFSICGIAFPHMEQYTSESRQATNAQLLENVSPLAVSAALGYVAHLVQMLAYIMDRPLRNPIYYEPSRSRIADEIKELTYTSKEFPLYTRSILPSQQTKYAIYLLRQNVSQLCYDITGHCDLRNTFSNLLELFDTLRYIERTQRDASMDRDNQMSVSGRHVNGLAVAAANSQLSQSHSSVDINHVPLPTTANTAKDALLQQLLPPGVSQALAIEGYASTQRICRSVGSYSDGEDEFRPRLEQNYSNSDSNITLQTERR